MRDEQRRRAACTHRRHHAARAPPNVVEVYELGMLGEHPYIITVTELVEELLLSLDDFRRTCERQQRHPLDLVSRRRSGRGPGQPRAGRERQGRGGQAGCSHQPIFSMRGTLSWRRDGGVKVGDFAYAGRHEFVGIRPVRTADRRSIVAYACRPEEYVRGDRGDARSTSSPWGSCSTSSSGARADRGRRPTSTCTSPHSRRGIAAHHQPLPARGALGAHQRATSPRSAGARPAPGGLFYLADLRRVIALAVGMAARARVRLQTPVCEMTEGMPNEEHAQPNPDDV